MAEKSEPKGKAGRPPSNDTQRGTREMRFRARYEVADLIVAAAERDGRTVANWVLRACEEKLERDGKK